MSHEVSLSDTSRKWLFWKIGICCDSHRHFFWHFSITNMESDCHIFLTRLVHHLIYPVYHFQCHFHFLKNLLQRLQMRYTWYFARKSWFNKKKFGRLPVSMLQHGCFTGVHRYSRVTFAQSKVILFWSCSVFQICYGTSQSVDERISETRNMKKILETSYWIILNLILYLVH